MDGIVIPSELTGGMPVEQYYQMRFAAENTISEEEADQQMRELWSERNKLVSRIEQIKYQIRHGIQLKTNVAVLQQELAIKQSSLDVVINSMAALQNKTVLAKNKSKNSNAVPIGIAGGLIMGCISANVYQVIAGLVVVLGIVFLIEKIKARQQKHVQPLDWESGTTIKNLMGYIMSDLQSRRDALVKKISGQKEKTDAARSDIAGVIIWANAQLAKPDLSDECKLIVSSKLSAAVEAKRLLERQYETLVEQSLGAKSCLDRLDEQFSFLRESFDQQSNLSTIIAVNKLAMENEEAIASNDLELHLLVAAAWEASRQMSQIASDAECVEAARIEVAML